MSEIRRLKPTEFGAFVVLSANAYPAFEISTPEDRERLSGRLLFLHQEVPTVTFYGLFREGKLLGGMRLHDFTMNFLGERLPACGVGAVAVDLLHKKEHVAKEMLDFFLRHYREQGVPLALLYPFRPDFYKRMGFGYGTQMNQYRVKPSAFPRGGARAHLRFLEKRDTQAVLDCYNRFVWRTHGMIARSEYEISRMLENPKQQFVGYEVEGQIEGYLAFSFERGESVLTNDVHVHELVYLGREALSELLAFLHVQFDQIRNVIVETQDSSFYFLLSDPRNGAVPLIPSVYHESNVQGVGLMYRVSDVPKTFELLAGRDFNGQSCRLKLTLEDSFLPENAGSTLLTFEEGRVQVASGEACDVEVRMDVAEFSSLLAGAVPFERLLRYGLAEISDPAWAEAVHRIFRVEEPPICMTAF